VVEIQERVSSSERFLYIIINLPAPSQTETEATSSRSALVGSGAQAVTLFVLYSTPLPSSMANAAKDQPFDLQLKLLMIGDSGK
jgi:hypothetical protein